MRHLKGRVAVVTGASRGIGTYIARALAREQMKLVLAARSAPELEAVASELQHGGSQVLAVPTDIGDPAALEALVTAAHVEFGGIDVLVNNAALLTLAPYDRTPIEQIERLIQVNLTAPMLLTRMVLPSMLAQGRGHIVQMASVAGKIGGSYLEPYSTAKAGLIVFTAALRATYREQGVSASVICPGSVTETGMYHNVQRETGVRFRSLTGFSSPEQVARAVVQAITHDRPEIIVNSMPLRPFFVLQALSPRLAERVLRAFGDSVYKQAGRIYERQQTEESLR